MQAEEIGGTRFWMGYEISYPLFGSDQGFAAVFELSSLLPAGGGDGSEGFVLNGIDANDNSGRSVSAAGDVDGDGIDDLILGVFRGDPNGVLSGESYVVFGRDLPGAPIQLGMKGNDGPTEAATEVTVADLGNNWPLGSGGPDMLMGLVLVLAVAQGRLITPWLGKGGRGQFPRPKKPRPGSWHRVFRGRRWHRQEPHC